MTPTNQLEIFNTVQGLELFPVAVCIFFVFDQLAFLRVPGQTFFVPERWPGLMGHPWRSDAFSSTLARALFARFQREHADCSRQAARLFLHRLGGSRRFFEQRGVLLCCFVPLDDRLVDFLDSYTI